MVFATACYFNLAAASAFAGAVVVLVLGQIIIEVEGSTSSSVIVGEMRLGSRLVAGDKNSWWASENGTFAIGFVAGDSYDDADAVNQFQLAIWFAGLPEHPTIVWSPNRDSLASKAAVLELEATGNLRLIDGDTTIWSSNTTNIGITKAIMSESGNFILANSSNFPFWESFSHPSDTLLPNQPLSVSLQLSSSPSHGGSYYTLKMLQQRTSLSLALIYNLPPNNNNYHSYTTNYSYWTGPEISNVTGQVVAVLDEQGSFGIMYGDSSNGAVYLYKNDDDDGIGDGGLSVNRSIKPSVLRRLALETNGNLRLYRWDDDVNKSRKWVPEWAAISNPCDIAGICGNGICNLDRSKTNASCKCLPGYSHMTAEAAVIDGAEDAQCSANISLISNCDVNNKNMSSSPESLFKIQVVQQTNYYFPDSAVIANYSSSSSNINGDQAVSSCGNACLLDCECVASVYGLKEEKPYCWVLKSLEFGGFDDPSTSLFVKIRRNFLDDHKTNSKHPRSEVLVLPIVLSMSLLLVLLCYLLYHICIHRRKLMKQALLGNSLILSVGAPLNFTYRDLQYRTSNFSELLGIGGFGSVYKGILGDGSLIAVKKLDKVLPHGEKEFVTEVNIIGSMHHMNLVRLCGYCSEGTQRLLVYEYMKNGSLDKWIFRTHKYGSERILDWSTRFQVAVATAQGIAYFHEQCRDRIIHCDIKPENILLDENFNPKVSDFGLAKLMGREHSHVMTMVRGTRGYLAPEWVSNRPITVKADVYSYGMLLLEIVGGRRNLDMSYGAQDFFYPGWAYKELKNGTPTKVVDKRIGGTVNEDELIRALKVAFWCIQDEVSVRPSMGEVVKMLEGPAEIDFPPMPQTVLELIQEGLEHVYKAMKRELNHFSSFTINSHASTSNATCSYSSVSPR